MKSGMSRFDQAVEPFPGPIQHHRPVLAIHRDRSEPPDQRRADNRSVSDPFQRHHVFGLADPEADGQWQIGPGSQVRQLGCKFGRHRVADTRRAGNRDAVQEPAGSGQDAIQS